MKSRTLLYRDDARRKLKRGIDAVADMVKVTLGPRGKNVVIDREFRGPLVTKDGVTVAKEIFLADGTENIGAQLVKQVASQTADVAGDGTTTATVLAQAMLSEGMRSVAAGYNSMDLKRGMEIAKKQVVELLPKLGRKVEKREDIVNVGSISANNDPEIGELIASAMDQVGNDGVITVDDSANATTFLDVVEGMQFDRGYMSPYFATKMDTLECILDNPFIMTFSGTLSIVNDLANILNFVVEKSAPILIVCDDASVDVLKTLIMNKVQGRLGVCLVKAPGFGDRRRDMLEDIALTVGSRLIDPSVTDTSLKSVVPQAVLGRAKRAIITKDKTVIVDGVGDSRVISDRVAQIRMLIDEVSSEYDKQKLQERLAKLTGGIAILRVGAATEAEMGEKKARIEDALHATRAASEEGIVAGGGIALLQCQLKLKQSEGVREDIAHGYSIVTKALSEPFRAIIENGGKSSEEVLWKILAQSDLSYGYNALTEELGDMYAFGVVDPIKVVRTAVENAVSIAGLLLTTEGVIVPSLEEKKEYEELLKSQM